MDQSRRTVQFAQQTVGERQSRGINNYDDSSLLFFPGEESSGGPLLGGGSSSNNDIGGPGILDESGGFTFVDPSSPVPPSWQRHSAAAIDTGKKMRVTGVATTTTERRKQGDGAPDGSSSAFRTFGEGITNSTVKNPLFQQKQQQQPRSYRRREYGGDPSTPLDFDQRRVTVDDKRQTSRRFRGTNGGIDGNDIEQQQHFSPTQALRFSDSSSSSAGPSSSNVTITSTTTAGGGVGGGAPRRAQPFAAHQPQQIRGRTTNAKDTSTDSEDELYEDDEADFDFAIPYDETPQRSLEYSDEDLEKHEALVQRMVQMLQREEAEGKESLAAIPVVKAPKLQEGDLEFAEDIGLDLLAEPEMLEE